MNPLLTDPVVLICGGIIVVGLFSLIWAVSKFFRLGKASKDKRSAGETPAPLSSDFLDIREAPLPAVPTPRPSPAVSREVAERLESMTQRLAEMQAVLAKQSSGAPADAAGAVGQGFSPETIDKLLKIIGNVMQQVDILHKSVSAHPAPPETPPPPVSKL